MHEERQVKLAHRSDFDLERSLSGSQWGALRVIEMVLDWKWKEMNLETNSQEQE